MKIALILSTISFIFSQANYQILSTSSNFKDIFEIDNFYENCHYSISNSLFPNDINLFAFTLHLKKIRANNIFITLKNLDYGDFRDNENNYKFSAQESLIQFSFVNNKIQEELERKSASKYKLNLNYLNSVIDTYQSNVVTIDLLASFQIWENHSFNISFKNWGKIINSYSNTKMKLPKTITLGYNFQKKSTPFSLIIFHKKRVDRNEQVSKLVLGVKINNKLKFYISSRSDKSDLFFGEYIEKMMAGTNVGISYINNKNNLNLAFQNLGAAGYITSFSFTKSIL